MIVCGDASKAESGYDGKETASLDPMRFSAVPLIVAGWAATSMAGALAGCVVAKLGPVPSDGAPSEGVTGESGPGDGSNARSNGNDATMPSEPGMAPADGESSDTATAGTVAFSIDVALGPARQVQPSTPPTKISDYIVNGSSGWGATFALSTKTSWGLIRKGGNAFTAWNWTNNYFNVGATACFAQRQAGGGAALAGAITDDVDSIATAQDAGAAYLATVPIVDFVSAAHDNDTLASCPTTSTADCDGGLVTPSDINSNDLDFASTDPASSAFVANAASKPGTYCTCAPGQACDAGCTVSSAPVYQDEFVSYLKTTYGSGSTPIFFDLDNEPNYWGGVHPEVWPFTGTLPCQTSLVTYDDIVGRDEVYAGALKTAWPSAEVFGPVVAQDGLVYAHSYEHDPHYPTEFLDYYLGQMAAASSDAGRPLLDVLDVHYYNAGTAAAEQCVQNPRMFWDPKYTSLSASATDGIDFAFAGVDGYFDTHWYPRQIVPRLQRKISAAYPATGTAPPALSFSEYNSGCETTIAGALAEADNLGIFGREGVFAAAAMLLTEPAFNYLLAAFDLYRNYDGNGSVVGDTAVLATTTNVDQSSVYAFTHSSDASAMEVVAINKTTGTLVAELTIAHAPNLRTASLYNIVDGFAGVAAPRETPAPAVSCASGTCALTYAMPPMSATTLVLR
jgi:hypothetical protein